MSTEREIGKLEEAVSTLKEEVGAMRDDIAAIREMLAHARGGWFTLVSVGGIASAIGGAVVGLAQWIKSS